MMTGRRDRRVPQPSLIVTRAFVIKLCLFVFLALFLPSQAEARVVESQEKGPLLPGAKVEGQIAGGEAHAYRLTLAAGEFVRLVVEGRRGDLVLSLQDAGGKTLVTADNAFGFSTQKRLLFVAAQTGDYHLTVRTSRPDAAPGSYRLSADEWRRAEAKDESAVAAERTFREAEAFNRQGSAEALRRAIEAYDACLPMWRVAGEPLPEAFTLLRIGLALHNLSRFKDALDRYRQALPIFEELGDQPGIAQTLTNLGWSHSGLGQFQQALDQYNRALEARRRVGEPRGLAQTLNLVADALNAMGEPQQAIQRYLEALPLARAGGDLAIEAFALNGLAWLYRESGELEKALECINRALPLWRSVGNQRGEAQSLNIRGTIHTHWLNPIEAQESFDRARLIWQQVGSRYGEAQVLNNTGILYQFLGDYERASDTALKALAIWQAVGNRIEEARTLNNLGMIEGRLGRLHQSLDYLRQALDLNTASGNRPGQIAPLHNISTALGDLGETEQALDYLRRALKLAQETGHRSAAAEILNGLGWYYEHIGDVERASEYYRLVLSIEPLIDARGNLARLEAKRGNLSEALEHIEKTIEAKENRHSRIADRQLRVMYNARSHSAYEWHADILTRLHDRAAAANQPSAQYLAAAFETSDRTRARSLLDTLVEARADIRQGADPALLDEEHSVQDRLNAREVRRTELLDSTGQEKRLTAIEKEIQELEWQLNDVRARIRTRSPAYAALTQPAPLKAAEIQKLLDDDTILLEYMLGEERSFLWAVTPTAIKGYTLPGRAEIEIHVRRLHELLTDSRNHVHEKPGAPAQSNVTADYDSLAATLSRILLAPVADQLGKKRLLIVSDGALQYLAFAALPVVNRQGSAVRGLKGEQRNRPRATDHRPLIADHEIVGLPSASVLAVLRRDLTSRPPAPKVLAVLADPVFDKDDPRVASNRATPPTSSASHPNFDSDIKRSLRDTGLTNFMRLRFSRKEANAISAFLPEKEKLTALDFTASRAMAQSAELGQYRVLHFATHGLLNSKHPDLSGLVFSLVDAQGEPQEGFLRLHEIYNLKLNSDLVLLSACQTALGKEVRGEGLIGLTRGFMYAGAPRVVASLWRVDDRATAELMSRFYRRMLKEGMRPAAALRAAQFSMLKEKRWSAPQYWAAFTLQGEWR